MSLHTTQAEVCLLCGSPETKLFLESYDRLFGIAPGNFALVECAGCGLVRLSPRPTAEQVANFYARDYWYAGGASTAGRLEEAYRRLVLRDHVSFALRAVREAGAGTVLDVGCSSGLFLRLMKERLGPKVEVLGLDFSAEAARVAGEINGVKVLVGDLSTAPVAEESCALVSMYHVVEHLLEPAEYLRRARELLQPGGRLIVQVPDRDCWEAGWLGENWTGLDVPRHIHVFRTTDLRCLLRDSGFAIVREKHFTLRDQPAGFATGLVPSLDPVVRTIRGKDSGGLSRLSKDLVYLGLAAAVLPITLLEACFGKGSSVMIEARKA